ncbi:beta-alanine transporter-like [Oppia nitens]|uniref:beta-alanine transporter-like n=1 Tax=Oppia nitens TaxID=1686743 RepID=UPI0023D9E761|nr:beta-alanine transporter-like [Oppia nitens]
MKFEDLLKIVGDFGIFQKLLITLFLIPTSTLITLYDYLFMLATPDHWCYVPQLANLSSNLQKQLISPETVGQGLVSLDRCHMYDIDYDLTDYYNNTTTTSISLAFNINNITIKECMEFVGIDYRSKTSSLSSLAYSGGSCLLPLVVYLTTGNWILLASFQLVATLPMFIVWRYLPESASWLITKRRYTDAYNVLEKVAKINGKQLPNDFMNQIQKVGQKQMEIKWSKKINDSSLDFLRVPELRKQTVILLTIFVANVMTNIGLSLNSLNFHANELLNYFLISLADIPALLLGWYLIESRLGRRWTNTFAMLLCGIALCIPILIDPSHKLLITVLSMIGKSGTAVSHMITYQQSAEIFPTTLRSAGMAICCTGKYGLWIPLFIMGSVCLIAGLASSFLPETLNKNLLQNSADNMEFEDLLKLVGDFGIFQKFLITFFLIPTSTLVTLYDYLFMLATPDHWCYVPELANVSADLQKQLISPETVDQGLVSYDRCRMYDIDYDLINYYNNSTTPISLAFNINNITTKECNNGWVYDKSMFTSTATTHFNLVCNNAHYVSILLSIGAIGQVILTPILSILTNWIGQKKSFLIVNIMIVLSFISPIVLRDYISFAICRFICMGFAVIDYQISYIMCMEFVGTGYRSKTSSLSSLAYSGGSCLLPVVVYLTTGNWILLAIFQLVATLPMFIVWRYLPESASWLITQRRYTDAYNVLERVAKINGKQLPNDFMNQIQKVGEKQMKMKSMQQKNDSYIDFLRVPELRKQTLIFLTIFVANVMTNVGLSLNSLNFHGNELLNNFLILLADIPSQLLGWYLIESRLGRRWTNTLSVMLCGIALCISILIDPSNKLLMTVLSMIGKSGIAVSHMITYQQSAEIFPTTLRSAGMGICSAVSSLSDIGIPYISYLGKYGLWIPMFIMGLVCIIAGLTSSFLPETLNENLPQTTADTQKFAKNRKYFSLAKTTVEILNKESLLEPLL